MAIAGTVVDGVLHVEYVLALELGWRCIMW